MFASPISLFLVAFVRLETAISTLFNAVLEPYDPYGMHISLRLPFHTYSGLLQLQLVPSPELRSISTSSNKYAFVPGIGPNFLQHEAD